MRAFLAIALAFLLSAPLAAQAEGSAEAGKAKSITCAACHGPNGVSVNPEWPSIAGQNERYLVTQLLAFKSGDRANPLMSSQAMLLSEQDIDDLAAFYASQPAGEGVADPASVRVGERVYRGGNKESGVAACIACHGPDGHGNGPAGIPHIAGQHSVYAAAQLRAYAAGERRSDMNQMMRNVAASLSEQEIVAVASYVQGLRANNASE